ncbi:CGNR zinc finger domain-containing protein [Actinopolymorpha rutila]|uniref:Putative RNA-binding Zn ribbon-like protein n=1 Tax=Actinopolymorpha rutila TaxID=446787 RepID=A0A852ZKD2_9ACTN|nr:ABATE domain-containing protein [Actinopolymorpha rutila]NYH92062.1 putative RNA-binding Zn ribbon-like protein [Actinopolymorpha rutila]
METSPNQLSDPRELPIVGGHLALDFANTVDDPLGPQRHDHAATYDDLVSWSTRVETVTGAQEARLRRLARRRADDAAHTLERAHELRDTLNKVFGRIADSGSGAAETARHWTRLRPFVTDAMAAATLAEEPAPSPGSPAWRWAWPRSDDLAVVLHPVAVAAADLLVSDQLHRLSRCARCPWLFLDTSKNHSRRWCDMNDCGKAQKIERYVARRAAARRGGSNR